VIRTLVEIERTDADAAGGVEAGAGHVALAAEAAQRVVAVGVDAQSLLTFVHV